MAQLGHDRVGTTGPRRGDDSALGERRQRLRRAHDKAGARTRQGHACDRGILS